MILGSTYNFTTIPYIQDTNRKRAPAFHSMRLRLYAGQESRPPAKAHRAPACTRDGRHRKDDERRILWRGSASATTRRAAPPQSMQSYATEPSARAMRAACHQSHLSRWRLTVASRLTNLYPIPTPPWLGKPAPNIFLLVHPHPSMQICSALLCLLC